MFEPLKFGCILFFSENIQPCGGELHGSDGVIVPPDSNDDGLYDLNVDCLWTIVVSENGIIRHKIDEYSIEDSNECRKDALRVSEIPAETEYSCQVSGFHFH